MADNSRPVEPTNKLGEPVISTKTHRQITIEGNRVRADELIMALRQFSGAEMLTIDSYITAGKVVISN